MPNEFVAENRVSVTTKTVQETLRSTYVPTCAHPPARPRPRHPRSLYSSDSFPPSCSSRSVVHEFAYSRINMYTPEKYTCFRCVQASEYMNNIVDANSRGILNIYTHTPLPTPGLSLITGICNFVNKSKLHLASVSRGHGFEIDRARCAADVARRCFCLIDARSGTRSSSLEEPEASSSRADASQLKPSATVAGGGGIRIVYPAVLKKIVSKESSPWAH